MQNNRLDRQKQAHTALCNVTVQKSGTCAGFEYSIQGSGTLSTDGWKANQQHPYEFVRLDSNSSGPRHVYHRGLQNIENAIEAAAKAYERQETMPLEPVRSTLATTNVESQDRQLAAKSCVIISLAEPPRARHWSWPFLAKRVDSAWSSPSSCQLGHF